jgi:O-antigen/teichoic acid export membrane protein
MNKSIFKNYIYNVAYQIATLLLPLITIPYVSRVLMPEGVGTAAFINSITQYFIMAGTLGINLYGNRQIAYNREDKLKMSETFWSIFWLKFIFGSISTILYVFFVLVFVDDIQKLLYIIAGIKLFGMIFDITWFFNGQEEFKKTVTRNMIVKIIGIFLIFTLVKDISDLWLYIFISSFTFFFGQAIIWVYIPKEVSFIKVKVKNIFNHLLPTLKIFIPQIAIQIYTVMDKTMIGLISNSSEVAFYENSQKIVKMTLTLATSLGVVMIPRISNYFANKDFENIKKYTTKSFIYISFLTFPMTFGLMGIAPEFVPWFFGEAFLPIIPNIMIISPIMIAIGWSHIIGVQMMIPMKKEFGFTVSVIFAAIVNFSLNLFLINIYQSSGAAISSVIAEFLVTIIQLLIMKKFIQFSVLYKKIFRYLMGSLLMVLIIRIIGSFMGVSILTTVIQILAGIIFYFLYSFITKSEVIYFFFDKMITNRRS